MARSIYITSAEGHSGKSTVALGVLDALSHAVAARRRLPPDRPVDGRARLRARDAPQRTTASIWRTSECIGVTYDDVHDRPGCRARRRSSSASRRWRRSATPSSSSAATTPMSEAPPSSRYNARIAANLGAPVLLVLGGRVGQGSARAPRPAIRARRTSWGRSRRSRSPSSRTARPGSSPSSPTAPTRTRLDEIVAAIGAGRRRCRAVPGARDRPPVLGDPRRPVPRRPERARESCARSTGSLRQGRRGAADARGARRRRRRHVDGQRPAAARRGRPRGRARRPHRGAARRAASRNASGTFPSLAGIVLNGGFHAPRRRSSGSSTASARRCRSSRTDLGTYDTAVA